MRNEKELGKWEKKGRKKVRRNIEKRKWKTKVRNEREGKMRKGSETKKWEKKVRKEKSEKNVRKRTWKKKMRNEREE